MEYLTIALPKGRMAELALEMFESLGINCKEVSESSRKLTFIDKENNIKFFLSKPSDVPTYVEYGAADMGIVGKDTLMEEKKNLYEVLDLGLGACKMVVAGPAALSGKLATLSNKRVATKYPRIASDYFERKWHETVEIIKLNGSVELAPIVGLSEVIVDLVESGRTLKENGLVVLDTVADVSARLVVNRVSMKIKNEGISKIINGINKILMSGGNTK